MTNLKRIIDEKGVQQRWLAEEVGVTEVSMSRYVSGERIPKAPIAIRMADALGVNVKDLYGWESEKRTEERTETHACDLISGQAAIDAHYEYCNKHPDAGFPVWSLKILEDLPSAQPEFDKEKISELLMRLYLMGLVHLTKDNIVRRQHYCEELWKALFHDDEFPVWMHWS